MTYIRVSTEEFDGDPRFYGIGAGALWAYVRLQLLAAQGHVITPPEECLEQLKNSPVAGSDLKQICWLSPVDDAFLAQKSAQDVRTLRRNLEILRQKCIIFVARTKANAEVFAILIYYKYQAERLKKLHTDALAEREESTALFPDIISNKDKNKKKESPPLDPRIEDEVKSALTILEDFTAEKAGANKGFWQTTPERRRRSEEGLRRYIVEFPAVDPLEVARAFVTYHIGKPPAPSWNQVAALRTFFVNALRYGRGLRARPDRRGRMEAYDDMVRGRRGRRREEGDGDG